jgi:hypothetical protein
MEMDEEKIDSEEKSSKTNVWRVWVPRLLAGAVGIVLLVAALPKAMDMEMFARQIRDYGIISHPVLLTLSAWGLIALECGLGIGLLVVYRPKLIFSLTVGLLLMFMGGTAWAWITGATEDCGCFGAWVQHTPAEAFLWEVVLLAATVLAWVGHRHVDSPRTRAKAWAVAIAFLVGLALPVPFGFSISQISASPWQAVETELSQLQIQGLDQIDLKKGAYLVILFDTECLHCQDSVPELDELSNANDLPTLIALSMNDESQRMTFAQEFEPAFRIGHISEDVFWRLLGLGDIPRTILVRDLRVLGVWDQQVPTKDMIVAAQSG